MVHRRHKKKVFSEREKDAIIRLSQAKVETKAYPTSSTFGDYLAASAYVAGSGAHAWQTNIFQPIPTTNASNTAPDDESFLGNDIEARGFRWECTLWSGDGVTIPGANYDTWFRWTLFEVPGFAAGTVKVDGIIAPLWDPSYPQNPIVSKWNMDYVNIRKQYTFKMDNNGSLNALCKKKFYVPIGRKIQKASELVDTQTVMGEIKKAQVYWALEVFSPGNTGNLSLFIRGIITTSIYFKDA